MAKKKKLVQPILPAKEKPLQITGSKAQIKHKLQNAICRFKQELKNDQACTSESDKIVQELWRKYY